MKAAAQNTEPPASNRADACPQVRQFPAFKGSGHWIRPPWPVPRLNPTVPSHDTVRAVTARRSHRFRRTGPTGPERAEPGPGVSPAEGRQERPGHGARPARRSGGGHRAARWAGASRARRCRGRPAAVGPGGQGEVPSQFTGDFQVTGAFSGRDAGI